jgi:predicted nucleic acid-binding Zn ribbon protein
MSSPDVEQGSGGDTKDCPYCGESILEVAKVCRYCGRDLITRSRRKPRLFLLAGLIVLALAVGSLFLVSHFSQSPQLVEWNQLIQAFNVQGYDGQHEESNQAAAEANCPRLLEGLPSPGMKVTYDLNRLGAMTATLQVYCPAAVAPYLAIQEQDPVDANTLQFIDTIKGVLAAR